MPIVLPRLAAVSGAWALGLLGLSSPACKRRDPPPPLVASPVPSASAAPQEMTRCRKLSQLELALDSPRPAPKPPETTDPADPGEKDEDEALLPFGVDIGEAVPTPFGFAAAGIRGVGEAFVALLAPGASRRIELGELHGDTETPAIAAYGQSVLVAVRTTDAAGFTIKLGRIADRDSSAVEWGHELTKLGRSVTNVELAASAGRGVLVYQSEVKGHPRLMLGSLTLESLSSPLEVKAVDAKDAEMPRLLARSGGFWLSWVRSLPEPKKTVSSPSAAPASDPEERDLLDPVPRVVEVLKLDEQGRPLGAPLRVGEPRRQILLYDVATLSDGGLLVAMRSDGAAPGAEGGAIVLSVVSADGTVREERLEDDEIGAGAPSLLAESDAQRPGPWLTVSGPNDATRLGLALGARTRLQSDPLLGRSEVVAVGAGRFLTQRARGSSVVLEALDCSWSEGAEAEKR